MHIGIYNSYYLSSGATLKNRGVQSFCGAGHIPEKSEEEDNLRVWNPYSYEMGYSYINKNLNKPQTITTHSKKDPNNSLYNMDMIYDPNASGLLYDRKTGNSFKVKILSSKSNFNSSQFGYHILSDNLKTEYGFISLKERKPEKPKETFLSAIFPAKKPSVLDRDYPEQNITGDRYEIEYFQNLQEDSVKGFEKLAQKIAVLDCINKNKPINIVLYAHSNSHIQNYKNGFRYLPLDKDSNEYKFFMDKYNNPDPNEVMENLLEKSDRVDTSEWGDLGMYLPRNIIAETTKNYSLVDFNMVGPFSSFEFKNQVYIDYDKPQEIILNPDLKDENNRRDRVLLLDYNPNRTGKIIDKTNGQPIEVNILKLTEKEYPNQVAYCFMSKDLKKEYGHVEFQEVYEDSQGDGTEIYHDFKKYGIKGDRLIVDWLENDDEEHYGGVGILADKLAVNHCIKNNLPLNIVSYSGEDSHISHYKRGKRFITPNKYTHEYYFLKDKYKNTNPNKVLSKLLKESEETGKKADLNGWGYYVMYLPKDIANKYKGEVNVD